MPPLDSAHHDIRITPRGDGRTYQATCSCGWILLRKDKATALDGATKHITSAIMWNGIELATILLELGNAPE